MSRPTRWSLFDRFRARSLSLGVALAPILIASPSVRGGWAQSPSEQLRSAEGAETIPAGGSALLISPELLPVLLAQERSPSSGRATSPTRARKPKRKRRLTADLGVDFKAVYDSNIYLYSPEDLERFRNDQDSARFAGIETYDDLVLIPQLSLSLSRTLSRNLVSRLGLRYTPRLYWVNKAKDYQSFSLSLLQTFYRRNRFELYGLYIPQYLIRPFPDRDLGPGVYSPCDYEKMLLGLTYERTLLPPTRVGAYYRREKEDYNEHFNEYDTHANTYGLTVDQTLSPRVEVGGEVSTKMARAQGYDSPGENAQSSDDADISHNEDTVRGQGLIHLRAKPDLNLSVEYQFQRKDFITTKPDSSHLGRRDREHEFSSEVELKLTRTLSLKGSYVWRARSVSSSARAAIGDIKDFSDQRVSLGVERTL